MTTFCIANSIQHGTCSKNYDVLLAEEATERRQLPFRGSQRCSNTSGKSARLATDTSSEHELPKAASGAIERSARDLAPMGCSGALSVPKHAPPPKEAHDILHAPRTRSPFPMHPYRCRRQARRRLQLLKRRQRFFPENSLFQTHS